ncbi:MAG TPA: DnaB-like helicase N-terminal domain-containing protein [bacterium]|nr:DnaB-like helicase N-terminal domain-containing protein [bacterium]
MTEIGPSAPPHDSDAERAVLGSMLLDQEALELAAGRLAPSDFYRDAHRVIFRAMVTLHRDGRPVDFITLPRHLNDAGKLEDCGGPAYIVSLPNSTPTARNAAFYIEIVLEKSKRRCLIASAADLSARVSEGAKPAADIMRDHRHALDLILNGDHPAAALSGASLVRASDIQPEKVSWAWADRFPFGALTIIAGQPGLGKSSIALEICARLTRGQLPGDASGTFSPVVLASAEDHRAATIVPRLIAAGADLSVVRFAEVRTEDGIVRGLILPDDLPTLETRLRETGARVLVVDPLVAHLPGTVNSWRDQDMRRALAPLAKMAEALGIAVVCIVHLNKSNTTEILARVSGSVGIVAAARSVFLVARDLEDEKACLFAHAKSNLSPLAPTRRFRIEGRNVASPDGTISTSGVAWLGDAPDVRACDLFPRDDAENRGEIQEAMEWLRDALSRGPRPAKEIYAQAQAETFSKATLKRAKERLGVQSQKDDFRGGWYWTIPHDEEAQGDDEEAQYPEVEPLRADASSKAFSDKPSAQGAQVSDIELLGEHSESLRPRMLLPSPGDGFTSPGLERCSACGGTRFWRASEASWTCATCHPPADPERVVAWRDVDAPAAGA